MSKSDNGRPPNRYRPVPRGRIMCGNPSSGRKISVLATRSRISHSFPDADSPDVSMDPGMSHLTACDLGVIDSSSAPSVR